MGMDIVLLDVMPTTLEPSANLVSHIVGRAPYNPAEVRNVTFHLARDSYAIAWGVAVGDAILAAVAINPPATGIVTLDTPFRMYSLDPA